VWWQLILVRFYHGFATAIFVPVAEASVAELFPEKRGERISLFSSATYVGRGIAPFLGGAILFLTNDSYHTLYFAVGVAGVTAFVMALLFLIEKKQPTVARREESRDVFGRLYQGWGTIIRNGVVLMASFIQASLYYTYGAVEFYLAGYLKTDLGFNSLLTSIVTGSLIVMPIFVRPYMGRLSDRVGRRGPIVAGLIVSAVPLLLIPFVKEFLVLLLLALVYGLGFATVTASTPALVSELVPAECIGASMGFLDTTMDIGQTIGSMISGFILATSLGYYGVFPSLGIVLLAASFVFAVSRVAKKRKNESLS
jgi:MFS family permease